MGGMAKIIMGLTAAISIPDISLGVRTIPITTPDHRRLLMSHPLLL